MKKISTLSYKYMSSFEKCYKKHVNANEKTDLEYFNYDTNTDDLKKEFIDEMLINEMNDLKAKVFARKIDKNMMLKLVGDKNEEIHLISPPNYHVIKTVYNDQNKLSDWEISQNIKFKCLNWLQAYK